MSHKANRLRVYFSIIKLSKKYGAGPCSIGNNRIRKNCDGSNHSGKDFEASNRRENRGCYIVLPDAAGFEITAVVENNPTAARSYSTNFHAGDPLHALARDSTVSTPCQFVCKLKLGRVAEAFDVVIGGPLCQAFAGIGRSKLREIMPSGRDSDGERAGRHELRWI